MFPIRWLALLIWWAGVCHPSFLSFRRLPEKKEPSSIPGGLLTGTFRGGPHEKPPLLRTFSTPSQASTLTSQPDHQGELSAGRVNQSQPSRGSALARTHQFLQAHQGCAEPDSYGTRGPEVSLGRPPGVPCDRHFYDQPHRGWEVQGRSGQVSSGLGHWVVSIMLPLPGKPVSERLPT